jgi:anti-anti-sigma regulatory factor
MGDMTLHVTASSSAGEGLVLAVEGYLDQDGGMTLARETRAVQEPAQRRIRIDLGEVCLFNCSGARQLITLLTDLEHLGYDVELVGVRPPLQRLLDLSA